MTKSRIHEPGFARSWIRTQNVHQRDFPIGNLRANQQGSFQPFPHAIRFVTPTTSATPVTGG